MSNLKIVVQGEDRKILIELVRDERHQAKITPDHPVRTNAQRRAIEAYESRLYKLHQRLDPNAYVYKNI